uniref:Uncharacterized protein n=1 Tax=Micrurus surinamensis TaxID=129470 RepID=A0A2D4PYT4_MICSU
MYWLRPDLPELRYLEAKAVSLNRLDTPLSLGPMGRGSQAPSELWKQGARQSWPWYRQGGQTNRDGSRASQPGPSFSRLQLPEFPSLSRMRELEGTRRTPFSRVSQPG